MTVRSVVIGLVLAILLGSLAYANDQLMRLNPPMANHFPASVFGLLLVFLAVNPLLDRLRKGASLQGKELAVILAMVLTACSIPRGGMLGSFTQTLVMPKVLEKTNLSWQRAAVLDYVPPALLPGGHARDGAVVEQYLSGRREAAPAGLGAVPWDQWRSALACWTPIMLLLAGASICLAQIVHPEWSSRERLRYPIAMFAESLLARGLQQAGRPVWRRQAFWLGLGIVAFIHLVNGLYAWFPGFIEIPMRFSFRPAANLFPWMRDVPLHPWLFDVEVLPTVVAFGTLLASDVGLSLGLANLLHVIVMAALLQWGADPQEDPMRGGTLTWQLFGSYVGLGLLVLYTGRHYYGRLALAALRPAGARAMPGQPVWAARGLVLLTAACTLLLSRLGLPWFMALLVVLLLLLMYLVISRLTAEAGLFLVRPGWMPATVLLGLFGSTALGPQALVVVMLLSVVLAIDPQMSLMPYVVNALKIGQDTAVRPRLLGWAQAGTYAVVLAVVLVVALAVNYNYGVMRETPYTYDRVPRMAYTVSADEILRLQASGQLETSQGLSSWQRLTFMHPNGQFLKSAGVGVALVLAFSFLRLRLPWWPLHPLIFLVWGTYASARVADSFLLGWIIRTITVRLGGSDAYRLLLVFMVGVIAGDILGGLGNLIAGAIYYLATNQSTVLYQTMIR